LGFIPYVEKMHGTKSLKYVKVFGEKFPKVDNARG